VGTHAFVAVFNASGWLLTLFTNDYGGQLSHGYALVVVSILHDLEAFALKDDVFLSSYGDDMLKSFSHFARSLVSPEDLAEMISEYFGFILTGIDKKDAGSWTTDPNELHFIGRAFKDTGGAVLAPLQQSSLNKMLHWVRKSKEVPMHTVYQSVLNSLMFESIAHGKSYYTDMQTRLAPIAAEHSFVFPYKDYDHAYHYYMEGYINRPRDHYSHQRMVNELNGVQSHD
jgi:hypothetical protein